MKESIIAKRSFQFGIDIIKKDFAYCMNVAKKEARETRYWLRLLIEINPSNEVLLSRLSEENTEIINMLTKIVKTPSVNL